MVSEGSSGLAAVSVGAALLQLLLLAGVYVWLALALSAVFRKTDQPAWKAWTPVVNLWTLFELAGMKGWWAAVQAGAGILTAVIGSVVALSFTQAAQEAAFSGSSGEAAGALLGAAVVPAVVYLAYLAGVVVLMVKMMIPLNRGFGLGGGSVVLGVVLLPVWASVVGWGSAQWRGLPRAGLPPTPFAQTGDATGPAATPSAPNDYSSFAPPAHAVRTPAAPAPVPPAPAPRPAASGAGRPAPVDGNPWMPPSRVAAPAPAPAAAPVPAAAADELDESTVLAAHRRPTARLRLPDGTTVALTGDAAVLGRNPLAPGEAPDAQRIAIDDVTRTVSKTHALLRRGDSGWTVTDLASTNGVFVGDDETEVAAATPHPVTGRLLLGDAELHLDADR